MQFSLFAASACLLILCHNTVQSTIRLSPKAESNVIEDPVPPRTQSGEPITVKERNLTAGERDKQTGKFLSFVQWGAGCGGSMIYEDIALSAAHCYNASSDTQNNSIYDGAIVGSPFGKENKITKFIPHPDFYGGTMRYDIIVLKLEKPVGDVEISRINNDGTVPAKNDVLTVPRLGENNDQGGAPILQEGEVDVIPFDECRQLYRGSDESVEFCATSDSLSACGENSGGPIFAPKGELVGIMSSGGDDRCGHLNEPILYSRISSAYRWIQTQICTYSSSPPIGCMPVTIRFESSSENLQQILWWVKDNRNQETMHHPNSINKVEAYDSFEISLKLMPGDYVFRITNLGGWVQGRYSISTATKLIEDTGFAGSSVFVRFTVHGQAQPKLPTSTPVSTSISTSESNTLANTKAFVTSASNMASKIANSTAKTTGEAQAPPLQVSTEPLFVNLTIELHFDSYPGEVGWEILEKQPDNLVSRRKVNQGDYPWYRYRDNTTKETVEVQRGLHYRFTIIDLRGDGICCRYGSGFYKIFGSQNELIYGTESDGSFGSSASVDFIIA